MYSDLIRIRIPSDYQYDFRWEQRILQSRSRCYEISYYDYKIVFYRTTEGWAGRFTKSPIRGISYLNISGMKRDRSDSWEIIGREPEDLVPYIREFLEEIDTLYYIHDIDSGDSDGESMVLT